jgi:hypothetical protein
LFRGGYRRRSERRYNVSRRGYRRYNVSRRGYRRRSRRRYNVSRRGYRRRSRRRYNVSRRGYRRRPSAIFAANSLVAEPAELGANGRKISFRFLQLYIESLHGLPYVLQRLLGSTVSKLIGLELQFDYQALYWSVTHVFVPPPC